MVFKAFINRDTLKKLDISRFTGDNSLKAVLAVSISIGRKLILCYWDFTTTCSLQKKVCETFIQVTQKNYDVLPLVGGNCWKYVFNYVATEIKFSINVMCVKSLVRMQG